MMNTNRNSNSPRLWNRATQALGKWWAGVISLPDRPQPARRGDIYERDEIYPRFPWF
jgi:hypothetical protein